jgi:hypothetical protein
MSNHCKLATTLLIAAMMASSLIMVESASALSIPKPSVPEFTVSTTYRSYDVEPTTTTTIDPYDGHISTRTEPGSHVEGGGITLSIKNQPFTSYYASNGYPIKLFYHVRAKGLDGDWRYTGYDADYYFEAADSTYTTFAVSYGKKSYGGWEFSIPSCVDIYTPDEIGILDFQVEAFIGYKNVTVRPRGIVVRDGDLLTEFVGQTSGWSDTQTVTIPNGAYTPTTPRPTAQTTSTPTPTDTHDNPTTPPSTHENQPEANDYTPASIPLTTFLLVTVVFIGVIVVLLTLLFQRQKNR